MPADDPTLYGIKRQRNLKNGTEISSSTTLSFTSQLSSLINTSSASIPKTSSGRARPKKDDIFATHNRNTSRRAKRDLEPDHAGVFVQKHTTNGAPVNATDWERSRRKMEDKARLYAAMQRGDLEDHDERYAVDFDTKWAASRAAHGSRSPSTSSTSSQPDEADPGGSSSKEEVEYTDEFGRTRKGTRLDALRASHSLSLAHDDSITARPSAPSKIIRGDAIQSQAFDPNTVIQERMAALAAKRDRSLTPPPDTHFDAGREVRTKGTGFFKFDQEAEERRRQMEGLEEERRETVRVRAEREKEKERKVGERKRKLEERREKLLGKRAKKEAEEFLEGLGREMGGNKEEGDDGDGDRGMVGRIEGAIEGEVGE